MTVTGPACSARLQNGLLLQEMLVGGAHPALPLTDMVEQITPAAPRHPREIQAHANAGKDPSLSMVTASFMVVHPPDPA